MINADVVFPEAAHYVPCYCTEYFKKPGTTYLNRNYAYYNQLNDWRVIDILDVFFTTPGIRPVGILTLNANHLTRVPSQIKLFDQIHLVINNTAVRGTKCYSYGPPFTTP